MSTLLNGMPSGTVRASALLGAAILFSAGAAAAHHVEKRFTVEARPVITIHNPSGPVTVKAWSKHEVQIIADHQSAKVEVDAEQTDNRIDVVTHTLSDAAGPDDLLASFDLIVPEDAELQIHSDSGSVEVSEVMGDMAVDTVAAGIKLQDTAGYLTIKTVGGTFECVRCAGRLEVNSISGNVRLIDMHSYSVRAQTSEGNILFDGAFLPNGTYRLKNYSGLIEVRFSPLDSFDLSANSVRGKVENDANLTPPAHGHNRISKFGRSLFGKLNQGKAKVELSSFDGTINIHRRP